MEEFNATLIWMKLTHIQTILQLYTNEFAKYFCLDGVKNTKPMQKGMIKYFY